MDALGRAGVGLAVMSTRSRIVRNMFELAGYALPTTHLSIFVLRVLYIATHPVCCATDLPTLAVN